MNCSFKLFVIIITILKVSIFLQFQFIREEVNHKINQIIQVDMMLELYDVVQRQRCLILWFNILSY